MEYSINGKDYIKVDSLTIKLFDPTITRPRHNIYTDQITYSEKFYVRYKIINGPTISIEILKRKDHWYTMLWQRNIHTHTTVNTDRKIFYWHTGFSVALKPEDLKTLYKPRKYKISVNNYMEITDSYAAVYGFSGQRNTISYLGKSIDLNVGDRIEITSDESITDITIHGDHIIYKGQKASRIELWNAYVKTIELLDI